MKPLSLAQRLAAHPRGPKVLPSSLQRAVGEDGLLREQNGLGWRLMWYECADCGGTGYVAVEGTDSGGSMCFADCLRGQVQILTVEVADLATGGVILGMLGGGWSTEQRAGRFHVWNTGDLNGARGTGGSLGEAAAMALLAKWGME